MLKNKIGNAGVLRNLISLNNLLQKRIKLILREFTINYLDYSILVYSNQNSVTQYKIAKMYNISVQRINQIMSNLEKGEYVTKKEMFSNGRVVKEIVVTEKGKRVIKKVDNELIEKVQLNDISFDMVNSFEKVLKSLLDDLPKELA